MKVIAISGKAQAGKDTTANILKEILEANKYRVLIIHYADLLKFICKQFFGWDGNKDEYGRHLLQYIGTDVVRVRQPDFWVDTLISILKLFPDEWDYVLIPDCRFPNEIDQIRYPVFDTTHLRIVRPNYDNHLTQEQKEHPSETALDNTEADYYIMNDGTIEDLKEKIIDYIVSNNGGYQMTFAL